jgi:hypothetical protein
MIALMLQRRHARRACAMAICTAVMASSSALATAQTAARVSGRLIVADGGTLLNGVVTIASLDGEVPSIPPNDVTISADGAFSFGGVPPGRYQIRARAQARPQEPALFATFGLILDGRDVSNIEMLLRPGILFDGQVIVENRHKTPALSLSSLIVRAPLVDGSGFGDALTGGVARDGSFVIRGLMIGTHQVVVEGLSDPWTIKQVLLRGHDITDRRFDVLEREVLQGARILVTDTASEVAGRVRDAHDQPARGTPVLVFAASSEFWMRGNRRLRLVRTDEEGRFLLRGLPPGGYLATASPSLDETTLRTPQALESLRGAATSFSVPADGSPATVTIRISRESSGPLLRP